MNRWEQIWNKDERINDIVLNCLIHADGFDDGAGGFDVQSWQQYTKYLLTKINLKSSQSIFEVGCGSGAFIFNLQNEERQLGGIDYSKVLVGLANTIFKSDNFLCDDAINMDTKIKFNVLLSHSVFQYFENHNYAKKVLMAMIEKADEKIVIFDVNDADKEHEYHQIRMQHMDEKEYWQKYQNLNHLFYKKSWFEDIAKEFGLSCEIFDQDFSIYENAKLRFNVIMKKND